MEGAEREPEPSKKPVRVSPVHVGQGLLLGDAGAGSFPSSGPPWPCPLMLEAPGCDNEKDPRFCQESPGGRITLSETLLVRGSIDPPPRPSLCVRYRCDRLMSWGTHLNAHTE